jgi:hypothetical protein
MQTPKKMYFEESQIVAAFKYLTHCKQCLEKNEDFVPMCRYFDGSTLGITLRASLDEKGFFMLFITPHWECFKYGLLYEDYERILKTGFLVDKVKELFKEKYHIKVDNRNDIYHGELHDGFQECVETKFCGALHDEVLERVEEHYFILSHQ